MTNNDRFQKPNEHRLKNHEALEVEITGYLIMLRVFRVLYCEKHTLGK